MYRLIVASALATFVSFPAARAADAPAPPASGAPAPAQEDDAARKKLEEDISRELGAQPGQAQPAPAPGAPSPAQPGPAPAAQGGTGGNPMARLLLLPDISAIGSFAGAYSNYDIANQSPRTGPFGPKDKPTPLFEEVELGLQSVIDPYARADIFISFTPDGVDVEEAYLTTLNLPAGLQLKAGKFFSSFGRLNQQHPHIWDFIDAPLAMQRLLADEKLSGPGVDVAWLAPLPWFAELHLAGQGTDPSPSQPHDDGSVERLTAVARLLQYFPLGEVTTLGVGFSAARRSEATGAFRDLGGADLYLRWRPLYSRSYVTLQGEVFARRFSGSMSDQLTSALPVLAGELDQGTAWGGYAQLFWRQDAYFGYGVRYDGAPTGPQYGAVGVPEGTEHRYSALANWYPSEFQRIRLQVSYDQRPGGQDGVEVLLGLEFGIGSHGAHPF